MVYFQVRILSHVSDYINRNGVVLIVQTLAFWKIAYFHDVYLEVNNYTIWESEVFKQNGKLPNFRARLSPSHGSLQQMMYFIFMVGPWSSSPFSLSLKTSTVVWYSRPGLEVGPSSSFKKKSLFQWLGKYHYIKSYLEQKYMQRDRYFICKRIRIVQSMSFNESR